jgi:hypothetical protein
MRSSFHPAGLRKTRPWELLVRFAFGGAVSAATGLLGHRCGPAVGGLFLAFPAILPASLTLVKRHDGRTEAIDDARGACLGSIGFAAFALFTWATATTLPAPVVLVVATVLWMLASLSAWALTYGRFVGTGTDRKRVA